MTSIIGIIPARYGSTRFPGKPLVKIGDKTMIQRVYEQASKAKLDKVIVATDDQRIFDEVVRFGGEVVMTKSEHPSGTDRCFEAYQKSNFEADIVVNIQGDEPFIDPLQIDQLTVGFENSSIDISSLCISIKKEEAENPNRVKVVMDKTGNALYFSRSLIPFVRESKNTTAKYFKHLGLYAYRANVLLELVKLSPSSLELAESLEQLRWLENGYKINMKITKTEGVAIDTPEDLEALLKSEGFTESIKKR